MWGIFVDNMKREIFTIVAAKALFNSLKSLVKVLSNSLSISTICNCDRRFFRLHARNLEFPE